MTDQNSSALVVLGYHELAPDGTHGISAVCRACVERAQQLPADVVVFSGWSSSGEPSEAGQMREMWRLPGPELLVEPQARNTAENAVYSLRLLLDRGGIDRVTVVCARHHRVRVPYMFGDLYREHDIDVSYEFVDRPRPRPRVLLREAGAIVLMRRHRRAALRLL